MTSDDSAATLVFMILSYLFQGAMLIICLGAIYLIRKWIQRGPVRTFGMSGFAMIGLSAIMAALRNVILDVARGNGTYNSISANLINALDFLTVLIRLVGIAVLAAAILSVGRDLRAVFSGQSQPVAPPQPPGMPPYGPNGTHYQPQGSYVDDRTSYAPRPMPSANPQPTPGTMAPQPYPPQGQPSASGPYLPQGQPSANQPGNWRPQG